MTDLVALRIANAKRWTAAKPTRSFTSVAARLAAPAAKKRYLAVTARTGVPWWFIALIHEREASQDWNTHLAQGDPLDKITRDVPAGEPAFKTWEDGAVDALVNCRPFAARNKDWSAGGAMTMAEEYNGLGYDEHGLPSPYVWSGTNQVTIPSGKYIRDRVFDRNENDVQPGCAGMLMAMMQIDPSITFTGAVIQPVPVPETPSPPLAPVAPSVAKPSLVASILSFVLSIFKKKG